MGHARVPAPGHLLNPPPHAAASGDYPLRWMGTMRPRMLVDRVASDGGLGMIEGVGGLGDASPRHVHALGLRLPPDLRP